MHFLHIDKIIISKKSLVLSAIPLVPITVSLLMPPMP